ncbi:MAG TPA: porin [Polyangiaceae bacterium]|nr:porin [Polyangiaceae bacterium]
MSKFLKASLAALTVLTCGGFTSHAAADIVLHKSDEWEFYTNGRIQAFLSYANGDAYPVPPGGNIDLIAGGIEQAVAGSDAPNDRQGKHTSFRVRSGFTGTELGFGMKTQLSPNVAMKGYVMINAVAESVDRRKYYPNWPDMRMSYVELSGDWGSFLAGRALSLYSRGATDITYLYGYKYNAGFVGSIDGVGPTAAHIGFGVLANGFAAGFKYESPRMAGLSLAVGLYDPSSLAGSLFNRTNEPRPEAELSYQVKLGDTGLLHLFANGAWQKLYERNGTQDITVLGAGYGGRLELGPVHLGLAGHMGDGLGIYYAFDFSEATIGKPQQNNEPRRFEGYYAQLQVALGKLDLQAGWGITRIRLLDSDRGNFLDDDTNPATPAVNDDADPATPDPFTENLIKHQMGISAGAVYHISDRLHFGLDYFRADFRWYLQEQKQVMNLVNAGLTMEW